MEQFSYMLDEKTNLQSCVNDFQQKCPKSYASLLVTIFPHGNDKEKIQDAVKTVAEALPDATIVGSTNSGGTKSCIALRLCRKLSPSIFLKASSYSPA